VSDAVVVIDYGMGNLFSVESALRYLGAEVTLSADPEVVESARQVILPGVGSFRLAMERLTARHLDEAIQRFVTRGDQLLGICLGMQLLGTASSEDGETAGLGIIPNRVDRFDDLLGVKVPHVGFNSITPSTASGLFANLPYGRRDRTFVQTIRMDGRYFCSDVFGRSQTSHTFDGGIFPQRGEQPSTRQKRWHCYDIIFGCCALVPSS